MLKMVRVQAYYKHYMNTTRQDRICNSSVLFGLEEGSAAKRTRSKTSVGSSSSRPTMMLMIGIYTIGISLHKNLCILYIYI